MQGEFFVNICTRVFAVADVSCRCRCVKPIACRVSLQLAVPNLSIREKTTPSDAQTQCRARIDMERNQRTCKDQHRTRTPMQRFTVESLFCLACVVLDKPGSTHFAHAASPFLCLCCMWVLVLCFLKFPAIVHLTLSTSHESAARVFERCTS